MYIDPMRPKITNDELVEAVEQEANERDITKTEAVRMAIRQQYDEGQTDPSKVIDLLDNDDLKAAHKSLWRMGSPTEHDDRRKLDIESASSVLAQMFGINKSAVKDMHIKPLCRKRVADMTGVSRGQSVVVVVDPDASIREQVNGQPVDDTDDEEVTNDHDMSELTDDAEPVRADGGETIRQDNGDDNNNE